MWWTCYSLNFCLSPKSVSNLDPNVMVSGGKAFGGGEEGWSHEGRTLMIGTSAITPRELSSPFLHLRTQWEEIGSRSSPDNKPASTLILNFLASRTVRDKFLFTSHLAYKGFPGGSVVKNLLANAGDWSLISGSGRFPGEGNGNPTPISLPGKSHGQKSLEGYSSWGLKRVGCNLATKQQADSSLLQQLKRLRDEPGPVSSPSWLNSLGMSFFQTCGPHAPSCFLAPLRSKFQLCLINPMGVPSPYTLRIHQWINTIDILTSWNSRV